MPPSNQNLSFRRQNPIDTITPEMLIEYQQLLDDMADKHEELTTLLNALEGAVLFREWQKQRQSIGQGVPDNERVTT